MSLKEFANWEHIGRVSALVWPLLMLHGFPKSYKILLNTRIKPPNSKGEWLKDILISAALTVISLISRSVILHTYVWLQMKVTLGLLSKLKFAKWNLFELTIVNFNPNMHVLRPKAVDAEHAISRRWNWNNWIMYIYWREVKHLVFRLSLLYA